MTDFWDEMYRQRDRIWSGNPNAMLVREIDSVAPGTALDLGCGEGADAVWLAQLGWQVTAVDVAPTALARAAEAAAAAGVRDRIDWQQLDLARSFPDGPFDLVSAQFLQSPIEFPREAVLQRAAAAVAPGGRLVVVGHGAAPPWSRHDHSEMVFPTPETDLASLALVAESWDVVTAELAEREATGPDGQRATLVDSVLTVRRRS